MKVYVITEGDYEDYHICAVETDKDNAEKLRKIFSDRTHEASIEEYDTETHRPALYGKKIFRVLWAHGIADESVMVIPISPIHSGELSASRYGADGFSVYLYALNKREAIHKSREMIMELLNETMG